jgi:GNAT superfamily N-acetyltransferase
MTTDSEVLVEPISSEEDLAGLFHCASSAFGHQTRDAIWIALNPEWDTPKGQKQGASNLAKRWKSATQNHNGEPNTVFLKATLPNEDGGKRRIVGMCIWQQASFVPGWGDPPTEDLGPGSELWEPRMQRLGKQVVASLWKRRISYAKEIQNSESPAIFVLDVCAVDSAFQRRGVAGKLVQWGLDEAKRRGGLECTTEASTMGRTVYRRLGFKDEGVGDMVFIVDEEFKNMVMPSNVFLRTGRPS